MFYVYILFSLPCRISEPFENLTNSSQGSLYLLLKYSQLWSDLWQIFNIPEQQFRLGSGKESLVQLKLEGDFRQAGCKYLSCALINYGYLPEVVISSVTFYKQS